MPDRAPSAAVPPTPPADDSPSFIIRLDGRAYGPVSDREDATRWVTRIIGDLGTPGRTYEWGIEPVRNLARFIDDVRDEVIS
jgi:hypothetical protein